MDESDRNKAALERGTKELPQVEADACLWSVRTKAVLVGFVTIFIIIIVSFGVSFGVTSAQEHHSDPISSSGAVTGFVRDAQNRALAGVSVLIRPSDETPANSGPLQTTRTDSQGTYRFAELPQGVYKIHAAKGGFADVESGEVTIAATKTTAIDFTMTISRAPELYDEPKFTVAGVTEAGSGGHGSDATTRATEALARETVSLSDKFSRSDTADTKSAEDSLRTRLKQNPDDFEANRQLGSLLLERGLAASARPLLITGVRLRPQDAESHHLLGKADEKLNNSLEAVREYQRAAEIDSSEANLFDWGTELLSHLALEPSTEVFVKGNHLFPKSDRMLIALGIAWYSRGFYSRAAQSLVSACDLNVADPEPYFFLGKLQELQKSPLPGASERLARFARLHPENALALYYQAIARSREPDKSNLGNRGDNASSEKRNTIESLLQQAVKLEPNFARAHLQLGIMFSERRDTAQAISEYKNVIEGGSADVDSMREAHYRLAQAYSRMGEKAQADREFELHRQLTKKNEAESERQRRNLQQFVISLQGNGRQQTRPDATTK